MNDFIKCKFCKSYNLAIKQYTSGMYLVCNDCGNQQEKIKSNARLREIYKKLNDLGDHNNLTYKSIRKTKKGPVTICGNCGVRLYASWIPAHFDLFDLSNANYCPNCGKRFLGSKSQK